MQKSLTIGRTYAVTTASTCEVTDANGTLITTASAGQQVVFVAPTTTVTFSDDSASVVAVFKLALAKLQAFGLFGGGKSDLPSGYIPALFLESAGAQYINIDYSLHYDSFAEIDVQQTLLPANSFKGGLLGGDTSKNYFAVWNSVWKEGYPRFDYNGNTLSQKFSIYVGDRAIFKKVAHQNFINGENFGDNTIPTETPTWEVQNVALFSTSLSTSYAFYGRIFSAKIGRADVIGRDFIPAIDKHGKPCMYDKVSKTSFVNANTTEGAADFVVGMTVEQARKLGKLPEDATTKTLTVSLPASIVDGETVTDAEVQAALETAKGNGWSIIYQTYTD